MNSFKKFLIIGIALANTNYYSISYSSELKPELKIGTGLEISGGNNNIDYPITVENKKFNSTDNKSKVAELVLGTESVDNSGNDTKRITLNKDGVITQTDTGHVHVYDHLIVEPGATIKATLYNKDHVNMNHDFDKTNKNTAGFDIHGYSTEDSTVGKITFNKGSNIEFYGDKGSAKYASPALYLCNEHSKLDVSNLLQKIDETDDSEYKKNDKIVFHIIGTTNESGNRQGTVDIFDNIIDCESGISDTVTNKIQELGDNNLLIENAKINIPAYKFEVVDTTEKPVEDQTIKVTALEPAKQIKTDEEGNPIYNTVNKTDKIVGLELDLSKEEDPTNTLKILKNNYLYHRDGMNYTLLTKNYLNPDTATDEEYDNASTGIKIKPPVQTDDDVKKTFSINIIDTKQIKEGEADSRATVSDFIKSVARSAPENKIKIYNSNLSSDYLNNKKYTLDLDTFNSENDLPPFKVDMPENAEADKNYIDMTGLNTWIDSSNDNPIKVLPIHVNLKGKNTSVFQLPIKIVEGKERNQIEEMDLYGNNSQLKEPITLMEQSTNGNNTYVNKLVFDKNSFVQTDRIQKNRKLPITWEFIGSNDNVFQGSKLYASKPKHALGTIVLNNKNNIGSVQVQLNNPNNKSVFNQCLYVDEIYNIPAKENSTTQEQPYSSLVSANKFTVKLINRENATKNTNDFAQRYVIINYIDTISSITEFNPALDPIVKYIPTSKVLQATSTLEEQLQKYEYDIDQDTSKKKYNVKFYTSIPKEEFNDLTFPTYDTNTTVNLDLTVAVDEETGNNKISFYNMMEYVYNKKYDKTNYTSTFTSEDEEEITSHNDDFSNKYPHLFIPLYRYQNNTTRYYFLTDFEVFPGYKKDTLITNFNNAIKKDKIKLNTIIPNLYIGENTIQFKEDEESPFGKTNTQFPHAKYAIYKQSTATNFSN